MKRTASVLLVVFMLCLTSQAQDRPNILLFTADDLHAESLGVYGGRPTDLTPNLDAFAAESMRFTRAHVNAAICAPCRAIIATGRYSHRSGAMGFMPARDDVPDIAARIELFRHRVPEEFYDLEHDPNCLVNLVDSPPYREAIGSLRAILESQMEKTGDPMLKAFQNRDQRRIVDEVLTATYGPRTLGKPEKRKQQKAKKSK